jgi:hypothetical protein
MLEADHQAPGIPCALCFKRGRLLATARGALASREGEGVAGIAISTQAQSSCPDLIRASIKLHENVFSRGLDGRIKPAMTKEKSDAFNLSSPDSPPETAASRCRPLP